MDKLFQLHILDTPSSNICFNIQNIKQIIDGSTDLDGSGTQVDGDTNSYPGRQISTLTLMEIQG